MLYGHIGKHVETRNPALGGASRVFPVHVGTCGNGYVERAKGIELSSEYGAFRLFESSGVHVGVQDAGCWG